MRHPRARRAVKWTLTVAAAVFLAIWPASVFISVGRYHGYSPV